MLASRPHSLKRERLRAIARETPRTIIEQPKYGTMSYIPPTPANLNYRTNAPVSAGWPEGPKLRIFSPSSIPERTKSCSTVEILPDRISRPRHSLPEPVCPRWLRIASNKKK